MSPGSNNGGMSNDPRSGLPLGIPFGTAYGESPDVEFARRHGGRPPQEFVTPTTHRPILTGPTMVGPTPQFDAAGAAATAKLQEQNNKVRLPKRTLTDMTGRPPQLTHNQVPEEREYREDADPVLADTLDLLERVYQGRLLVPDAYDAFVLMGELIPKLHDRLTLSAREANLRRTLGNPLAMPPDFMPPPNPSPRGFMHPTDTVGQSVNEAGTHAVLIPKTDDLPSKVRKAIEMLESGKVSEGTPLHSALVAAVTKYFEGD